jgi:hypothetical protein
MKSLTNMIKKLEKIIANYTARIDYLCRRLNRKAARLKHRPPPRKVARRRKLGAPKVRGHGVRNKVRHAAP